MGKKNILCTKTIPSSIQAKEKPYAKGTTNHSEER